MENENENEEINNQEEINHDTFPSDERIKQAIFQLLETSDASKMTKKDLKQQLETAHGWDLSEKKALLSEALMEYFEKLATMEENGENESEDIENDLETEDNEEESETLSGSRKRKNQTGNRGFHTPVQLSTKLSQFLGGEVFLRRPEVTQRIWKYIRDNNLQNPNNRREIICDDKFQALFKKKKMDMFKMTKILSEHMKSVAELQNGLGSENVDDEEESDHDDDSDRKPKKRRITKVEQQINARQQQRKNISEQKEKELKKKRVEKKGSSKSTEKTKKTTAFNRPVELSPKLSEFLGYSVVPRTEVPKLMWKYIKEKDLQDPSNKRIILCDKKMENLFQRKHFTMFEMTKYLNEMMTATSLPSDYVSEES